MRRISILIVGLILLGISLVRAQSLIHPTTPERGFPGYGVLDDNVLASWNGVAGDAHDYSRSGFNGTITGAVGYVNGAWTNTPSSFIDFGTLFESLISGVSNKFTFAFWCKPAVSSPGSAQVIMSVYPRAFYLESNGAGAWDLAFLDDAGAHSCDLRVGFPAPTAGVWVHHLVAYDPTVGGAFRNRIAWYINGASVSYSVINDDLTTLNPSGTSLQIGAVTGVNNWNGLIANVVWWTNTLNAAQVLQEMESSRP